MSAALQPTPQSDREPVRSARCYTSSDVYKVDVVLLCWTAYMPARLLVFVNTTYEEVLVLREGDKIKSSSRNGITKGMLSPSWSIDRETSILYGRCAAIHAQSSSPRLSSRRSVLRSTAHTSMLYLPSLSRCGCCYAVCAVNHLLAQPACCISGQHPSLSPSGRSYVLHQRSLALALRSRVFFSCISTALGNLRLCVFFTSSHISNSRDLSEESEI